jgi:hypothetical protein
MYKHRKVRSLGKRGWRCERRGRRTPGAWANDLRPER